jgi:hypothetical protein
MTADGAAFKSTILLAEPLTVQTVVFSLESVVKLSSKVVIAVEGCDCGNGLNNPFVLVSARDAGIADDSIIATRIMLAPCVVSFRVITGNEI